MSGRNILTTKGGKIKKRRQINKRLLPPRREKHAQMLEDEAMKEQELNRKETYIRH